MSMKAPQLVGIVLVILGIVALLSGGVSWTRNKTIIDMGPIKATTQERESIALPPLLGAVGIVAGVILLLVPMKRRA